MELNSVIAGRYKGSKAPSKLCSSKLPFLFFFFFSPLSLFIRLDVLAAL